MRKNKVFIVALVAVAMVAVLAPAASAANGKIGEFKLLGNYDNSVGNSKVKMEVTEGSPLFASADVFGNIRDALVFDVGQALTVSRIPRAARSTYTIEMVIEYDDLSGYRRILSFGPNTVDRGLYFYDGYLYLYPAKDATTGLATANTFYTIRLLRTSRGNVRVYLDNTRVVNFRDTKDKYTLKDGMSVLLADDGDEEGSGTLASVKVYNKALIPN